MTDGAAIRRVGDPVVAAAAHLADRLARAQVTDTRSVGLLLSGGRTPRAVLPLVLARKDIDWTRVEVAAGDERLVPQDHPDSTEGMIAAAFAAADRPLRYRSFGSDCAAGPALERWRQGIETMPWPPVAAFLGMGEDGHIASLFPGSDEAADAALFAAAVPETPPHAHARLTLGPAALTACRSILLVAAGPEKRAMLDLAMTPGADPRRVPAAWIARLPQTIVLTPEH